MIVYQMKSDFKEKEMEKNFSLLRQQLADKDAEIERLRGMVVMRFDHEVPPQFEQGYSEHEVLEPVTAEHCRWFVGEIDSLRQQLSALQKESAHWKNNHTTEVRPAERGGEAAAMGRLDQRVMRVLRG